MNPGPFNHESSALTTKLSPPPYLLTLQAPHLLLSVGHAPEGQWLLVGWHTAQQVVLQVAPNDEQAVLQDVCPAVKERLPLARLAATQTPVTCCFFDPHGMFRRLVNLILSSCGFGFGCYYVQAYLMWQHMCVCGKHAMQTHCNQTYKRAPLFLPSPNPKINTWLGQISHSKIAALF